MKSYAEGLAAELLEKSRETVRRVIGRKSGVYVLTKGGRPYYVGLASRLRSRLETHLEDRHHGKWDRFNIYSIGKKKYLKDVETILIRVADPRGNHQRGSFGKHRNLTKKLKAEILRDIKDSLSL